MLLLYQKMANEEFQVNPVEWNTLQHKKDIAKWQARGSNDLPSPYGGSKLAASADNAKTKE